MNLSAKGNWRNKTNASFFIIKSVWFSIETPPENYSPDKIGDQLIWENYKLNEHAEIKSKINI